MYAFNLMDKTADSQLASCTADYYGHPGSPGVVPVRST